MSYYNLLSCTLLEHNTGNYKKKKISASNSAYTEDILDQLFCKVLKEVLDGGGREECMNYYTSTADFDAVTL